MEEARKIVRELVARSKAAQNQIKDYSQEQVDRLVKICGRVIYDNAEILAQEAVEEGKLGNVPDKIGKMKNKGIKTSPVSLRMLSTAFTKSFCAI